MNRLVDLIWRGVFALYELRTPKPLDQQAAHQQRIREQENARADWIRDHRSDR